METKEIIHELRTRRGLSQDELAEKIFVTRQAVSRWENGETVPNVDTLKLLSKFFDVSINTLLGSPRQLVCQCCGEPFQSVRPNAKFCKPACREKFYRQEKRKAKETEDFPLILIQFGAATSHGLYGHSGDRRKAPSHGYGF